MKLLVVCCIIAVAVAARPPNVYTSTSGQATQVLRYENNNDGLGSYQFAFEQSDGTAHGQSGELKNQGREDESIAVKGTYSWIAPDGFRYIVVYVADDNGYQPDVQKAPGDVPVDIFKSLIG